MLAQPSTRGSPPTRRGGRGPEVVTRQIENARAYAERKGWTVAEEHVYADDGISGAEFGDGAPGSAADGRPDAEARPSTC